MMVLLLLGLGVTLAAEGSYDKLAAVVGVFALVGYQSRMEAKVAQEVELQEMLTPPGLINDVSMNVHSHNSGIKSELGPSYEVRC